jgi:parallel beta-helix repeat protein
VNDIVLTGNTIEYNGKGIDLTNANGVSIVGNTIVHNNTSGLAIMQGCTNVSYSDNTFGQNYKHALRAKPIVTDGWKTTLESDVLVRNSPAVNAAGTNTYL